MKNLNLILGVLIIIAGAGGFWGGMKYQQSKQPAFFRQFTGQTGGNQQGARNGVNGNRLGFRPVNGEISGVDDKSVTVKLQDGSSKIVILSEKTLINKADEAQKEDLKVGTTIMVIGQENSDGSVTAQNIQLNPVLRLQNR